MGSREPVTQPEAKVTLIPWDHSSDAHFQRLYDQRVACTWDYEAVASWKETVSKGTKLMYWVVCLLVALPDVLCCRGGTMLW